MMLTAEESKKRYQTYLGADAGAAFYEIVGEVLLLHAKWGDYLALFDKESRVDLLNEAAPEIFARLQYTLLDDVMLHVARLADPPKSMGKTNLSIKGVVGLLPDHKHSDSLKPLIADFDGKVAAARDWRNRRIAHIDYDLAVGKPATPLAPTSRASVKEAIEAGAGILNAISIHYTTSNLGYDFDQGPATDLIYVLDEGIRAAQRRKEKWAAGKEVPPDELPARDL